MALERELATFHRLLPSLLEDRGNVGKFVLIHEDTKDSIWDTVDDALAAGYDRFGLDAFMVKQIVEHERPQYFSRNVTPCQ